MRSLSNISFQDKANEETHSHGKRDLEKGVGGKKLSDIRDEYADKKIEQIEEELLQKVESGASIDVTTNIQKKIDKYKEIKKTLDEEPNLYDWDAQGKNTQEVGQKGYKNGQSKSSVPVDKKTFNIKINDRWDDKRQQGIKIKFSQLPLRTDTTSGGVRREILMRIFMVRQS